MVAFCQSAPPLRRDCKGRDYRGAEIGPKESQLDLTHSGRGAILGGIGVVHDLSRLALDWTGQVGFGEDAVVIGPQDRLWS